MCPSAISSLSNAVTFITNCPVPTGQATSHRMINAENEIKVSLNLYPNPVVDNLSIQYNGITGGTAKVNIFNMIGKNVMSTVASVEEGMNTLNLNTFELPAGIYFLEVENNGELIRSKFMVSK